MDLSLIVEGLKGLKTSDKNDGEGNLLSPQSDCSTSSFGSSKVSTSETGFAHSPSFTPNFSVVQPSTPDVGHLSFDPVIVNSSTVGKDASQPPQCHSYPNFNGHKDVIGQAQTELQGPSVIYAKQSNNRPEYSYPAYIPENDVNRFQEMPVSYPVDAGCNFNYGVYSYPSPHVGPSSPMQLAGGQPVLMFPGNNMNQAIPHEFPYVVHQDPHFFPPAPIAMVPAQFSAQPMTPPPTNFGFLPPYGGPFQPIPQEAVATVPHNSSVLSAQPNQDIPTDANGRYFRFVEDSTRSTTKPAVTAKLLQDYIIVLDGDTNQPVTDNKKIRNRKFACKTCSRPFHRKSDLVRHIQIHLAIKPNVCCRCGKQFIQRSALTVHSRVHTGEKPFFCPHCGRNFSDSSSLARHRRIHLRKAECAIKEIEASNTDNKAENEGDQQSSDSSEESASSTATEPTNNA